MLSIYLTWSHMITPERNNTVLASYITLFHQSLIERSLLPVFSTEIVVWLYFFSYWRFQFFIILADYPESINTVHQVAIKLPTSYKHSPNTWIDHLEAQFAAKNKTFYWAISSLPSGVSSQLTHLIRSPGGYPYKTIKNHLICLYSPNDYQRSKALINLPLSGDNLSWWIPCWTSTQQV